MKINWDYLAGFTDGEGYLGVIGRGPRITWGQKDKFQLEVIKEFLESEGLHPHLIFRKPKSEVRRPNAIWALNLTRRDEVLRVTDALKPRLVLKRPACLLIEKWAIDNPPRANMQPVDPIRFKELFDQGYNQIGIAKKMNYGTSTIAKFAKKNGYVFKAGGITVGGKRLPTMTKEEYSQHRKEKEMVAHCPKCGGLMWKNSLQCRDCANKDRPKRGHKSLIEVRCANCGKTIQKLKSQLKLYPNSFCDKICMAEYGAKRWSKQYGHCIDCGTTDKPHIAKGRCRTCHNKWYRKTHPRR